MKIILFIAFLIVTATLPAQQTDTVGNRHEAAYEVDPAVQLHPLKNNTTVLIDSSNALTVQEISSEKFSTRFQSLSDSTLEALPYKTYWLKFSITATGDIQDWWLIMHDPELINKNAQNCYVDVYFLNKANQVTNHQRTGVFVPRSQKTIKENPSLNRVLFSIKAGETKVVYLKIYNEYYPAIISEPQLRNPVIGLPSQKNEVQFSVLSAYATIFSVISFFFFLFCPGKVLPVLWHLYFVSFPALPHPASYYTVYRSLHSGIPLPCSPGNLFYHNVKIIVQ